MNPDRIRSAWPKLPSRLKDALVAVCLDRVFHMTGAGIWSFENRLPDVVPRVAPAIALMNAERLSPAALPAYSSTWEGFGAVLEALDSARVPWLIGHGLLGFWHAAVPARTDGWATLAERGSSAPDALSLAFVLSRAERVPEEFPLGEVEHG